jgi:hypothetical protein
MHVNTERILEKADDKRRVTMREKMQAGRQTSPAL